MPELIGSELVAAIERSNRLVFRVISQDTTTQVTRERAIALAASGRYHARETQRIRTLVERERQRWQPCWRNTQAAVLQPGIEWLRGVA